MASMVVEAEPRSGFGKGPNRRLRAQGKVPAILYGADKEVVALAVDPKAVIQIIRSHGGVNTIFELSVKGAKRSENVMIKEYQLEPVEHRLLHADMVRIAMDKEMILDVAIELTGIAKGVKTDGGMLDFVTRTVEVSCLPKDIPETVAIDVSDMEIGDYVRVSDLVAPKGTTLVSDGNVVVAHLIAPRAEEEVESTEEGGTSAEGAEGAESDDAAKAEEDPAKE